MARLIDADKINYHEHTECMGHGDFETVRTVTDKEIAEIPTADVAPVRHGRWIAPFLSDSGNMCAECSNCHRIRIFDDYCSACGAIMDLNDLED